MAQALFNTLNELPKISENKLTNQKSISDKKNNFEQLFEKTKDNYSKQTKDTNDSNKNIDENKTDLEKNNSTQQQKESANTQTNQEEKINDKESKTEEENSSSQNNILDELKNSLENLIITNKEDTSEEETTTEEFENTENNNNTETENNMNITKSEQNTTDVLNIINTSQTVIPHTNIKTTDENTNNIENSNTENEDELNVSINGNDIDTILNNYKLENSTNNDEITNNIINLTKKETSNTTEKIEGTNIEDLVDEDMLKELNIENIDSGISEENSSADSDLMQNQSAEEQGIKAMFQTEGDFADIKVDTTLKPTQNIQTNKSNTTTDIGPSKIVEQISKQLEGLHNNSKVNIVLNPESLGKVSVQLINTKEGLSAQFTVATQDARNLIMKGLDGLKDTLMAHGVSVDNVTVKMNETQESSYQADWTEQEDSRGGNKEQNSKREEENKQKFAETMYTIENQENGKV